MKQEKDYRFYLSTFLKEQEQEQIKTEWFYVYQFQIENNGCYKIQLDTETVKVYTPQLAIVLASNEMSVLNLDTNTETTINGFDYLETYVKAYKEGEQYFESEYKVSQNILYSPEGEQYVRGIHENFFHTRHTTSIEGWGYVKKSYPIILTHKNIKEFGYYSGIVNKVEELVKKHRFPFVKFEKCEHDLISEKTEAEVKTEQPKTFEELFYNPEHAKPCLEILSELHPPVIDAINNYIGKAKGIFPLWVKVLKNHKPEPLIKHFKDTVYKDLLNQKVNGLKLSKDASEFRKQYKRIENDKIELDIKAKLSQYSQSGKLGK